MAACLHEPRVPLSVTKHALVSISDVIAEAEIPKATMAAGL